jgi:hypothetical protein
MKIFRTLLLVLFVSSSLYAQRLDKEKVKTLKIAYLTEKLDLTVSEAEIFWPIHNEFEKKVDEIKLKSVKFRKQIATNKDLSEEDTKKILVQIIQLSSDRNQLEVDYFNRLLEILPAKKVVIAISSDKEFKRKMIEEYKERHRKLKNN